MTWKCGGGSRHRGFVLIRFDCATTGFLQGNSAPVNIPDNFSPNLFSNHFSHIGGSAPKMHNSFGALGNNGGGLHGNDNGSLFFQPHLGDALAISPELG